MNNEMYREQILKVKELGEQIGYGNLMDIASVLWGHKLEKDGFPNDGAFYPMILMEIKDGDLKEDAITNRIQKSNYFKKLGIWED